MDPKTYVIGPEDVLLIRVWREADLSGPVIVRPDGRITVNLIGEVQAGGMTPEGLTAKLKTEFSKLVNEPEVMVSVQAVRSKKYYITGKANKTGAFPLVVPTTVLDALSQAGGLQEWAKESRIVILRGKERIKFNYKEVVKGKNLEQNILLQNGDHVLVP